MFQVHWNGDKGPSVRIHLRVIQPYTPPLGHGVRLALHLSVCSLPNIRTYHPRGFK
jgi:hypothetical protein